jgi:signal transduction histidine kinase
MHYWGKQMLKKDNSQAVILLVDDNLNNLKLLIEYLKHSGFKVLIAKNGIEAIKRSKLVVPDLILLDIMMPGMNGYEVCDELKKCVQTSEIPIIFMTALTDTTNKVKGFEHGAVDYITKPFQHEEVLMRISTHLTIIRQKKRLAELNATKDKFFSIVAHDMRNAFASLLNGTQFLSESVQKLSKDQIDKFSKNIYSSAKNTFKLLQNLLEWARLQRGAYEYAPQLFDFHTIAIEMTSLYEEMAKQKNIHLTHDIVEGTFIHSDSQMIKTILRNFITNAIKYTYSEGSVHFSMKQDDGYKIISVKDTGVGIPHEEISNFFQIDTTHSAPGTCQETGTGLGLILCKELAEKCGGNIWVESVPQQGSTFYVSIRDEQNDSRVANNLIAGK